VSNARETCVQKKQSPAGWQVGVFDSSSAQAPDTVHQPHHQSRHQHQPEERMSETPVMGKAEDWVLETAKHVDIRRFGGQGERGGRQRRLAVQAGSSQTGAGEEVGDGFQSVFLTSYRFSTSNVIASGTTVISAGSVPSSSPSASMKIREFVEEFPGLANR
jgi:hypothetical protein